MKRNVRKKIIVGIITIFLALICFTMTNASNAEDVVETWDISAHDGKSHVTATLYSDGNMIISGIGKTYSYVNLFTPYSFFNKDIKIVTIEEGVTDLGNDLFEWCDNLETINIPQSLTYINQTVTKNCANLKNIIVSENNSKYKDEDGILFSKDGKELLLFPVGRENAEYIIPEEVTKIRYGAFSNCTNLKSIEIPDSVTSIGDGAFYNCSSLTSIEIPNSVTSIEYDTFNGCTNLKNIEIPDSVTSIGNDAFYNCSSLTSIEIPNSVTSIEEYAFWGCTNLRNINIPNSITSIGYDAFYNCTGLASIEIPDSVTSIERYTFANCTTLTSIEIPNSITNIGTGAFKGCKNLKNIKIPESVTEISDNIFENAIYTITVLPQTRQIDLPDLLKRAINEDDILYANENIEYNNCSISSDKTKLIVNDNVFENNEYPSIKINEGKLIGLEIRFILSGTITYTKENWTNENVTAILHLVDEEQVINNDEKISYVFEENGEFLFEYRDINGNIKQILAKVENIDKEKPIIKSVEKYYDKENVVIKVEAEDNISGLQEKAYRFNEGREWDKPWQKSNEAIIKYDEKILQVRDNAGNIQTYEMLAINDGHYERIEENGIKYIELIKPNTKYREIRKEITTNGIIEIYKGNTKVTDVNEVIGTGMTLKAKLGDKEERFKLVVTGDVTGDGKIKMADLLKLARYKAGIDKTLNGAYLRAGDVVKNGEIGMPDILKLSRVLAEIENL